jgi:uncharacterized membrane protein YeaQ/YmgE (transglycosylase-associated protein family)
MEIVSGLMLGLIAGVLTSLLVRRQVPDGTLEVVAGGIGGAFVAALVFALLGGAGLHLTAFTVAFIGASAFVGLLHWLEQTEPRQTPRSRTKRPTSAANASRRYPLPSGRRDARLRP